MTEHWEKNRQNNVLQAQFNFQRELSYFPRIIFQRGDHPTKADQASFPPSVNASTCFVFVPTTKKMP